jgi:hypothetical protein
MRDPMHKSSVLEKQSDDRVGTDESVVHPGYSEDIQRMNTGRSVNPMLSVAFSIASFSSFIHTKRGE